MSYRDASFAAWMKTGRKRLRMSQQALADAVGLDRTAITRMESGDRDPRLSEARQIASVLGFSLGDFNLPDDAYLHVSAQRAAVVSAMDEARTSLLEGLNVLASSFHENFGKENEGFQGQHSFIDFWRMTIGVHAMNTEPEFEPVTIQEDWQEMIVQEYLDSVTGHLVRRLYRDEE